MKASASSRVTGSSPEGCGCAGELTAPRDRAMRHRLPALPPRRVPPLPRGPWPPAAWLRGRTCKSAGASSALRRRSMVAGTLCTSQREAFSGLPWSTSQAACACCGSERLLQGNPSASQSRTGIAALPMHWRPQLRPRHRHGPYCRIQRASGLPAALWRRKEMALGAWCVSTRRQQRTYGQEETAAAEGYKNR